MSRSTGTWGYTNMNEVARQLEAKIQAINDSEKQIAEGYERHKLLGMAKMFDANEGGIKNKFYIGADGKKHYNSDPMMDLRIHAASTPVNSEERYRKLAEEGKKNAKKVPRYGSEGQKEEEFAEEMGWNR